MIGTVANIPRPNVSTFITASYTHPNHTGDVTSVGDGAQTISPTAISGKTGVTAVSGDYVLLWDATDSTLKKANVSTFITSSSVAFDDLTSKTAGTGDYLTTGDLGAGENSGGPALTINDGYGNANLTFNHRNGTLLFHSRWVTALCRIRLLP